MCCDVIYVERCCNGKTFGYLVAKEMKVDVKLIDMFTEPTATYCYI